MFDDARGETGIVDKLGTPRNSSHFQMQMLVMVFGQAFDYSFSYGNYCPGGWPGIVYKFWS